MVAILVDYTGQDYEATTIYDPYTTDHEIVSTWDSVNLKAVATYEFDPMSVEEWDTTYSWLMTEIKVSDDTLLDGTGQIIISSSLVDGDEELVYAISGLEVLTDYDKFMIMIQEFTGSTFDETRLCRMTVWVGATSEVTLKWRKARLIHINAGVDATPWLTKDYVTITIDHDVVPADMTYVPLRVVFDESNAGFPILMKDFQSSLFAVDSNGDPVYFAVEAWDTYSCVLWMMLNEVSTSLDMTVVLYYDETGALTNEKTLVSSFWVSGYPTYLAMERSGDVLIDETADDNEFIVNGAKCYRLDGLRRAQFNGISDYLEVPVSIYNDIIMSEEGSVTFELEPDVVVQNDYACLMSKATADSQNYQAYSFMWAGSNIKAEFCNASNGKTTLVAAAPTALGRAVVTFQWSSESCDIWVNGSKITTGSIPVMDVRNDLGVYIGGKTYGDEYGSDEYYSGDILTVSIKDEIVDDDMVEFDHLNRLGLLTTISGVPSISSLFDDNTSVTLLASPTSALSEYQLEVTIHSEEGISRNSDLYLGDGCLSDCSDIVITDEDGIPVYYTILDTDYDTYATYAVKFVDIPESGITDFTIYYGWDDCPDLSDDEMTYEDWDSATIVTPIDYPPTVVWWGTVADKFMFEKTIVVDASPDGAFDQYQLDITIHRDEGTDSSTDVYISTHCRSDYRDIVFFDEYDNVLSHYISDFDAEYADIIVEFNDIPSSGSKSFKMRYKSNAVLSISDYKGTINSGRESTTNPPSIASWGTDTLLESLSSYSWIKTFTISSIPLDGWFGVVARINRTTGTDNMSNTYLNDHCDSSYGDLLCTTSDDSKVIDYYIAYTDTQFAIVKFLMNLTTTSGQTFNLRYGKSLVDNQTDWRPVIISVPL